VKNKPISNYNEYVEEAAFFKKMYAKYMQLDEKLKADKEQMEQLGQEYQNTKDKAGKAKKKAEIDRIYKEQSPR